MESHNKKRGFKNKNTIISVSESDISVLVLTDGKTVSVIITTKDKIISQTEEIKR